MEAESMPEIEEYDEKLIKKISIPQEISVTFIIEPHCIRHQLTINIYSTILQIKNELAEELRLDIDAIVISELDRICHEKKGEPSQFSLLDSGLLKNEETALTLNVNVQKEKVCSESENYKMPDAINVEVQIDGEEDIRCFPVQILKFEGKKNYLGGFRNKNTSQVYHHASVQTKMTRQLVPSTGPEKFTRETQTQNLLTRSQQTRRECGTQMERLGIKIDNGRDRSISAKPYFNSTQLACLRADKTLIIQCYWRGYLARSYVKREKRRKLERDLENEEGEEFERIKNEKKKQIEIQKRMHPRTFGDFEVLYNELDNWRLYETQKIEEEYTRRKITKTEKLNGLAAILEKETKLLQTIDRLKLDANRKNRDDRIKAMLDTMSRPKQWQMSDGDLTKVHTPFTTRASELQELYSGLSIPRISVDDRLDVLLHVKWTVREFDCSLSRDLIELIDREADILNRGRSDSSVSGLRKRILNLFLQFIETPEFNPEAAIFSQNCI